MDGLATGILGGDRRALARGLSVVERRGEAARRLVDAVWERTGRAARLGVTGPAGVGKSTLVDGLAQELESRGGRVGILAVDPSSAFTRGALLGDRIRMTRSADSGVFIRSMASRGRLGGLAPATSAAADLMDAAGFDWVIVETVGVGQDEVEVAFETDLTVVVLAPGAGDGVQALKAGLMEIGDVFVVNKGDRPGAEGVKNDVEEAFGLSERRHADPPPVLITRAAAPDDATGIAALAEVLVRLRDARRASAAWDERRRDVARRRLLTTLVDVAVEEARSLLERDADLVEAVASRRVSVHDGARRLLRRRDGSET